MDPDLSRVSDLILPLAHHQTTDDVGFPAEKIKTRIKVTFLAAIALLSLAAFFFSAILLTRQIQCFNFRPVIETLSNASATPCSKRLSSSLPNQ
ncbi:hypothetical protein [Desulfosarcina variabilis]|uniref:hypothetical protein n=1 Tax=Desulfosarcina variabilis TaxID=2300 RepID=UPI003AFACAE9